MVIFSIDDYNKIIRLFDDSYKEFSKKWNSSNSINMKRRTIYDIHDDETDFINDEFSLIIKEYYNYCNIFMIEQKINLKSVTNKNIRARIKDIDSLMAKIHKKRFEKNGRFPINKVINDIVGFRIIDSNFEQNNKKKLLKLIKELTDKGKIKIRILNREGKEYKATHIYFKGINNYCFPIELQIWDEADKETNIKAHNLYKQNYINYIENFNKFK
ncbi:MAG: hypothetical protein GX752_02115 [Clostridium sp.]|nr:hypothetical protein [Clostridium sp.]